MTVGLSGVDSRNSCLSKAGLWGRCCMLSAVEMRNRWLCAILVSMAFAARAAATTAAAPSTESNKKGGGSGGKAEDIKTGNQVWCVAKPQADQTVLLNGLNFACGEGGADCAPIQPNGACYNPPTLVAHASYAFNSYYQKKGRNYWNCYFQNAALLVVTDPSYGSCNYPAV